MKKVAILGLVAALIYALIQITIDYYLKESILWNKIAVKSIVFGVALSVILYLTKSNKKK